MTGQLNLACFVCAETETQNQVFAEVCSTFWRHRNTNVIMLQWYYDGDDIGR